MRNANIPQRLIAAVLIILFAFSGMAASRSAPVHQIAYRPGEDYRTEERFPAVEETEEDAVLFTFQIGNFTITIKRNARTEEGNTYVEASENTQQEEQPEEILLDPEISPIAVDFEALKQRNADVAAWLYCPDTAVNYAVVQTEDNMFYLHNDFDGNYSSYGTLFVDCLCERDFRSTNSIIYGHHMNDGRMFAMLVNYARQEYFERHPVFYLNTPDMNYRVELFSGYITGMNSHSYDISFKTAEENQQWLDSIVAQSAFSSPVEVKPGDRILTLSTCTYEYDDARFVVHGKLVPIH